MSYWDKNSVSYIWALWLSSSMIQLSKSQSILENSSQLYAQDKDRVMQLNFVASLCHKSCSFLQFCFSFKVKILFLLGFIKNIMSSQTSSLICSTFLTALSCSRFPVTAKSYGYWVGIFWLLLNFTFKSASFYIP